MQKFLRDGRGCPVFALSWIFTEKYDIVLAKLV